MDPLGDSHSSIAKKCFEPRTSALLVANARAAFFY